MAIQAIVLDEMIDPVIEGKIQDNLAIETHRVRPSESDDAVLSLASEEQASILTRDRDFVRRHRDGESHFGILFDPGMHHRTSSEVVEAITTVLELMDEDDLKGTVVRLNRFY